MADNSLRQAVIAAGGTPTGYDRVTLWRNYVSALGGSPAYYNVIFLVRQAILAKNGSPVSYDYTSLLRQLVTALGGTPASYRANALVDQLVPLGSGNPDLVAPVLTSPSGTQLGPTTATLGVTTDEGAGTLYYVVTASATPPTALQVENGQNNAGTAAVYAGNQSIGSVGAKTAGATGLAPSTTYYAYFMHKDIAGNRSNVAASASFTTAASDVVAPTLSSPTAVKTSTTAALLGVTTNEANGTLYWVLTTSATPPTAAQVKLGQNNGGTAAAASGNQVISTTGAKTANATGLTVATTYYAYFMHEDASANQSTVAAAASFNTNDTFAPTLSAPSGTGSGTTTAGLQVTTDEGNGTLYWVVTLTSTPPTAAQVKLGQNSAGAAAAASGSAAVASAGTKSASATGLTASTNYYAHFMHEDAAANQSAVASAAQFTTTGVTPLATPTLTNYSATGVAPVILSVSTTDYVAGMFLQLQIATDSGFTAITQDIVTFIDGDSWARLDQNIGLVTPSGTFYARARTLRDNETGATTVTDGIGNTFQADASAWSTTYTDTISSIVSQWATGTSDKSQWITLSGANKTATCNANLGAPGGVRSDTNLASGSHYWEFTINGHGSQSAGNWVVGIVDATTAVGPGAPQVAYPGNGGAAPDGACFVLKFNTTQNQPYYNGAAQSGVAIGGVTANGDKGGILVNRATNQVSLYYKRGAGAWNLIQTITMTSKIPANVRAFFAGMDTNDGITANFGATAYDNAGQPTWV